jgi:hypothetical protein
MLSNPGTAGWLCSSLSEPTTPPVTMGAFVQESKQCWPHGRMSFQVYLLCSQF